MTQSALLIRSIPELTSLFALRAVFEVVAAVMVVRPLRVQRILKQVCSTPRTPMAPDRDNAGILCGA